MQSDDREMALTDHLKELRERILKALAAFFVCAMGCYLVIDKILAFVVAPFKAVGGQELVTLEVTEAFFTSLKLSGYFGLFLGSPAIIYQFWAFVRPALFPTEKKMVRFIFPAGAMLFVLGVAFCYVLIVPVALNYLIGYGTAFSRPQISLSSYISFVGTFCLVLGSCFELPLVLAILLHLKLLTLDTLHYYRRHNILAAFVIAAILTPPDPITQTLMAVPLILLYELTLLFAKMVLVVAPQEPNR